jgi:hypothetical protein
MFLFLDEIKLKTVVKFIVQTISSVLLFFSALTCDQSLYMFFELVYVNNVLFFSSLILFHHVVPGSQGTFMLIDGFFKQLNLFSDVLNDPIFDFHCLLQSGIFFLKRGNFQSQNLLYRSMLNFELL